MKKRQIGDLIWNGIIVLSILWAVAWYYIPGHIDAIGSTGVQSFRYFTTDSNLLIAAACLLWMKAQWQDIHGKTAAISPWLRILRYTATAAGTLTFLEVLLFMAPMALSRGGIHGAMRCYEDNVFVLHFSAPFMMILSFLFSDREYLPGKRDVLWAMVPMGIYSIVYLFMVVILKIWPDFYRFTFGGRLQLVPVVMCVMYLAAFGIAKLLQKLKTRISGKN